MEHKRLLTFPFEVKDVDDSGNSLEVEGLITTQAIDRDNEIVLAEGVDNLHEFANSPLPYYYEHGYARGALNSHIGHALSITPQKKAIKARFSLANTDLVRGTVWPLLENGSLRAHSIGFVGREHEIGKNNIWTWTKWSLREVSLVSMPANIGALAAVAKSLGYEWGPIEEDAEVDEAAIFMRRVAHLTGNVKGLADILTHWQRAKEEADALPLHDIPEEAWASLNAAYAQLEQVLRAGSVSEAPPVLDAVEAGAVSEAAEGSPVSEAVVDPLAALLQPQHA